LGQGGFLGSRVRLLLPREIPDLGLWPPRPLGLPWTDPDRLEIELEAAARSFAAEARTGYRSWMIAWCAGSGGVGTRPETLQAETRALFRLLELASAQLSELPGVFALSSSAGGVYGSCPDLPLTEASPCQPISEYGRNKILQETRLLTWAAAQPDRSCLVARLSNLYGPGQRLDRPQGLISRLSWSLVRQEPLHIYVPLDTLRDHLWVDDAARSMARCLLRLRDSEQRSSIVKVFASEQSISLSGILGIFARITRRMPRVVSAPHPLREQQPRGFRFRSTVWRDLDPVPRVELSDGIHSVIRRHLALHQTGNPFSPSRRPGAATPSSTP
jgi:UDP-glucose 4-epimerase